MMESCGICFPLREAVPAKKVETEYVAPELLPERPEIEIAQKWDASLPTEKHAFEYSLLPPGLIRAIISRIGNEAGLAADYWRNGLYVYETGTGSRALIEQETTSGWQGRILVQTQRGQAAVLLERLKKLVDEEQRRLGISAVSTATAQDNRPELAAVGSELSAGEMKSTPPLKFGQEPSRQPEYFVSYSWGDSTPEGAARESVVDHMCAAAEKRGITILRDKKVVGLGDRISKFMQRLGRGDRVFVVLTDKYLKSSYCMYELHEVWRNCREDDADFVSRIRVFTLPDAKIYKPIDRVRYAAYWKKESSELEAAVKEGGGIDVLGRKDHDQYWLMRKFTSQVGDILATIADIVQPRTFEDFEKYGLDDPGTGGK